MLKLLSPLVLLCVVTLGPALAAGGGAGGQKKIEPIDSKKLACGREAGVIYDRSTDRWNGTDAARAKFAACRKRTGIPD